MDRGEEVCLIHFFLSPPNKFLIVSAAEEAVALSSVAVVVASLDVSFSVAVSVVVLLSSSVLAAAALLVIASKRSDLLPSFTSSSLIAVFVSTFSASRISDGSALTTAS